MTNYANKFTKQLPLGKSSHDQTRQTLFYVLEVCRAERAQYFTVNFPVIVSIIPRTTTLWSTPLKESANVQKKSIKYSLCEFNQFAEVACVHEMIRMPNRISFWKEEACVFQVWCQHRQHPLPRSCNGDFCSVHQHYPEVGWHAWSTLKTLASHCHDQGDILAYMRAFCDLHRERWIINKFEDIFLVICSKFPVK